MTAPAHGGAAASITIGVLDLQGDVREHVAALAHFGVESRRVKRPDDLHGLAGLILHCHPSWLEWEAGGAATELPDKA